MYSALVLCSTRWKMPMCTGMCTVQLTLSFPLTVFASSFCLLVQVVILATTTNERFNMHRYRHFQRKSHRNSSPFKYVSRLMIKILSSCTGLGGCYSIDLLCFLSTVQISIYRAITKLQCNGPQASKNRPSCRQQATQLLDRQFSRQLACHATNQTTLIRVPNNTLSPFPLPFCPPPPPPPQWYIVLW